MICDALDLCYVHFSPWEVRLNKEDVLKEYSSFFKKRNAILLSHYLMTKYANFKGYQSYFCKDNFLYEFAFQILLNIPNSIFVYLYRDPRDYALSQLKRSLTTDSIYEIARLWQYENVKSISIYLEYKDRCVYKMSYENFICNEKLELKKLAGFLNIKMNDSVKVVDNLNSRNTEDWVNLDKDTMESNFNKYKNELTKNQIRFVESICWDEMKWLGYKTEAQCKPCIGRFEKYMGLLVGKLTALLRKKKMQALKAPEWQIRSQRVELVRKLAVNYRVK